MMKAAVYKKYGSPEVVELVSIPKPIPKPGEVLVKIKATTVTPVDTSFRSGAPWFVRLYTGLLAPKRRILGTELSGVVDAIGADVTLFSPGDRVFAAAPNGFGAHAEYFCIAENAAIVAMPDALSFDQAAALDNGALTALPFLRDTAQLQSGQRILIIGASGSIGCSAVQLAALMGAEVTGVCSTSNLEMVRNLGAGHVIDYTQTDVTSLNQTYDVVFDTVGKSSFGKSCGLLAPTGIFITTVPDIATILSPLLKLVRRGKRAKMTATGLRKDVDKVRDMNYLKELVVAGQLTTVIDRSFPLEQIALAHTYVETGRKRGNLIIHLA